ncbi:unnamed protein product, partial [marine sediment metagenome]
AGPEEDQDILHSMVRHEQSYMHWIEKETAGEEGAHSRTPDVGAVIIVQK